MKLKLGQQVLDLTINFNLHPYNSASGVPAWSVQWGAWAGGRVLPLVHFSAQPEPFEPFIPPNVSTKSAYVELKSGRGKPLAGGGMAGGGVEARMMKIGLGEALQVTC